MHHLPGYLATPLNTSSTSTRPPPPPPTKSNGDSGSMRGPALILLVSTVSVWAQSQCDATIKNDLKNLQTAQVSVFTACAPGKKIWQAITNTQAPNFKSCICDKAVYGNLTQIRQYQALCDPNDIHGLASTDALIGQWKVSCGSGLSTNPNAQASAATDAQTRGLIVAALSVVAALMMV